MPITRGSKTSGATQLTGRCDETGLLIRGARADGKLDYRSEIA